MRTPPADLGDDAVAAAVAAHWSITSTSIDYAPVGFGSHHWLLTGPSGRWFITADAVADSPARMAELAAALATAHALRHRCGLEFVVAAHLNAEHALLSGADGTPSRSIPTSSAALTPRPTPASCCP